jgi:hypothetical protein
MSEIRIYIIIIIILNFIVIQFISAVKINGATQYYIDLQN